LQTRTVNRRFPIAFQSSHLEETVYKFTDKNDFWQEGESLHQVREGNEEKII
jgi:hypothetical protein